MELDWFVPKTEPHFALKGTGWGMPYFCALATGALAVAVGVRTRRAFLSSTVCAGARQSALLGQVSAAVPFGDKPVKF